MTTVCWGNDKFIELSAITIASFHAGSHQYPLGALSVKGSQLDIFTPLMPGGTEKAIEFMTSLLTNGFGLILTGDQGDQCAAYHVINPETVAAIEQSGSVVSILVELPPRIETDIFLSPFTEDSLRRAQHFLALIQEAIPTAELWKNYPALVTERTLSETCERVLCSFHPKDQARLRSLVSVGKAQPSEQVPEIRPRISP